MKEPCVSNKEEPLTGIKPSISKLAVMLIAVIASRKAFVCIIQKGDPMLISFYLVMEDVGSLDRQSYIVIEVSCGNWHSEPERSCFICFS